MGLDLQQHTSADLAVFNKKFQEFIAGDFPEIEQVYGQLFQSKGKQLRPLMVLLTHRLFREEISEQAYLAASLVEIVHMASLVHDDVVDMADIRRGKASIRSLFGNKTAVLAGDYMLTNAFLKAYDGEDTQLLLFLVEVIRQMSAGELIQLENVGNPDSNEETYYRIIERKTAALFGCCCQCGAHTAQAGKEEMELVREIGRNAGLVFQIKDDLLDLDTRHDNGKQYGNDLLEGKLTLPALHYLQHCPASEKEDFFVRLHALVERHNSPDHNMEEKDADLDLLIDRIKQSGGEEYAVQQAGRFTQQAWDAYRRLGKESPAFEALLTQICQTR
ncbi:MAG: polyprenyl synthetase family protein [Bacteroides sp.]|nr:polyprenyl synthetase family protein [Bacteroides sp.]MCM1085153.1 polyprenyl synthetase family protein [Bacteroides sp.]